MVFIIIIRIRNLKSIKIRSLIGLTTHRFYITGNIILILILVL